MCVTCWFAFFFRRMARNILPWFKNQDPSPFLNGFAAVLPLLRQLETLSLSNNTRKLHPQHPAAIQTLLAAVSICHLKNLEFKLLSSLEDYSVFAREIPHFGSFLLKLDFNSASTQIRCKRFPLRWLRAFVYSLSTSICPESLMLRVARNEKWIGCVSDHLGRILRTCQGLSELCARWILIWIKLLHSSLALSQCLLPLSRLWKS